jgi:hypothetical protein
MSIIPKYILPLFIIVLFNSNLYAFQPPKGLKFGMTKTEVEKTLGTTMTLNKVGKHETSYNIPTNVFDTGFSLGQVVATFSNDKNQLICLHLGLQVINEKEFERVRQVLKVKYGTPSFESNVEIDFQGKDTFIGAFLASNFSVIAYYTSEYLRISQLETEKESDL